MEDCLYKNRAVARRKSEKKTREAWPATVLGFTEDHFWVRTEGNLARVGLSGYGQEETGEIVAADLPEIGDRIERGEPFGELESVRTIQELVAPVSGTVVAANTELEDNPFLANDDPHYEGWLIEVCLAKPEELDRLMGTEEYEDFVTRDDQE